MDPGTVNPKAYKMLSRKGYSAQITKGVGDGGPEKNDPILALVTIDVSEVWSSWPETNTNMEKK